MKHFYKALLLTILFPALTFAQSNFKPGYVVTLKGDTLRGFIDYREWNSNPDAINFKRSIADDNSQRYTPEDISYFNITGFESYIRYSGAISMDATEINQISQERDTTVANKTVFFKIVQKGKNVELYAYTDGLKARFYKGEAPNYTPKELTYRLYYKNGSTVSETTYMNQLFELANKYQVQDNNLQSIIEHSGYNQSDLLSIVSKINHISKAQLAQANVYKGPAFNLFIGAAVNIDNFTVPASSPYYAGGGRSQTSTGPSAAFGANLFVNPATRQLQFRIELGVAQSKYNYAYQLKVSPYIPFRASFNETAFSVTPQILYNFYNAENFKVYGDAGISFGFYSFSNNYLGSQSQPNSATDIEENNPYTFHKADNSFLLKIGVQIHKNWGIYAQYLSSVSVTEGGYFQMGSTCEQIGVNYYFW